MARRLKQRSQDGTAVAVPDHQGVVVSRRELELSLVPKPPKSLLPVVQPSSGDKSLVKLATRALLRRAEEARTDPVLFYNLVIKHETTKVPLIAAPHQELTFRFVMHHPLCVVREPIGTGKTFEMGSLGLYFLGADTTSRGAIVSKAQGMSAKVLRMVSDYIIDPVLSAPLILVYPWLKKSAAPGSVWTQTAITVDRPAAIRDPSLIAVGLDGQIQGSRLSWFVGDDILDADNTMTQIGREQTHSRFDSRFFSRLDPVNFRGIVTNTPWHLEDLTYKLEELGWPTITMDIYGNIWFSKSVSEQWIRSTGLARESRLREGAWRLTRHDPDYDEVIPLWPARYDLPTIETFKSVRLPHEFARQFLCQPFDDQALRCQKAWTDAAKREGSGWLGEQLAVLIEKGYPIYIGVDLGVGKTKGHDQTVFFIFLVLPDRRRVIVDVSVGRWDGPTIRSKLIEKFDRYGGVVAVENNNAQTYLLQFTSTERPDMHIRGHYTGVNKYDINFGVESIFAEIQNGQWIIPTDSNGMALPEVEKWINECLYYQPPPHHTGDRLIASWIGREASRRGGGGRDPRPRAGGRSSVAGRGSF